MHISDQPFFILEQHPSHSFKPRPVLLTMTNHPALSHGASGFFESLPVRLSTAACPALALQPFLQSFKMTSHRHLMLSPIASSNVFYSHRLMFSCPPAPLHIYLASQLFLFANIFLVYLAHLLPFLRLYVSTYAACLFVPSPFFHPPLYADSYSIAESVLMNTYLHN